MLGGAITPALHSRNLLHFLPKKAASQNHCAPDLELRMHQGQARAKGSPVKMDMLFQGWHADGNQAA